MRIKVVKISQEGIREKGMFIWAAFFRFAVFSSKDMLELVYGRELEKCNSKVMINGISINQFID